MNIGVNALYLRPGCVGGTERYLRELLKALAEEAREINWVLFLPEEARGSFTDAGPQVREVIAPVRAAHRVRRVLAEQRWLPRALHEEECSVCFNPGASLSLQATCPQVTTIHDCVTKVYPGQFSFLERRAIEFFVALSLRRSSRILVPSAATATDLSNYYSAPAERIIVTPLAASSSFSPNRSDQDETVWARHGLRPGNYFLCVASSLPHKNLPLLFAAYRRARKERPGLPELVWAGPGAPEKVRSLIGQLNAGESVRVLAWRRLEEMASLYRGAKATFLASSFEGFGLAALEAAACGCPLLTTPCAALREVMGPEAALFTRGFSEQELAGAILRLDQDEALRTRLAQEGPQRAAQFSWTETARRTLAALRPNA